LAGLGRKAVIQWPPAATQKDGNYEKTPAVFSYYAKTS